MKRRLVFHSLLLLAVFLALVPTALASSTWYVDGVNGNDNNDCKSRQHACKTIGHAISLASSGDSIMVAAATYTENLTISTSLKVIGSGAATTIIDGGGVGQVVTISNANAHVTLSKLTIRNGSGNGGGIYNGGTLTINNSTVSGNTGRGVTADGGGINNGGTLTINNSTMSGNRAAGLQFARGGGIYNGGTLTINNSTVSGNTAGGTTTADGGGIYNVGTGTLTINNSTVSGNTADARTADGGGIYNGDGGTLTINNSTVSGNTAHGEYYRYGGGILNHGTATLQNSIVANSLGGNCAGTMTSNGYNLSSDGYCNFSGTGDLNNTDPKLGQLGHHGGPTQTIPLLTGSPAIDAGNPSGCTDGQGHLLKTDQRGRPRHDKEDTSGCDMGAYERQKD
ncbi:MAG TPA: right-handed parallel beta-helix repeat-containing protein [Terriglobales bacterium]|nr:right-handed parallel beta-helix repeat-containing protein [Terriglobales bacterium]